MPAILEIIFPFKPHKCPGILTDNGVKRFRKAQKIHNDEKIKNLGKDKLIQMVGSRVTQAYTPRTFDLHFLYESNGWIPIKEDVQNSISIDALHVK